MGASTLNKAAFDIMTLRIDGLFVALSIDKFSITTVNIIYAEFLLVFIVMLSRNAKQCYAECRNAKLC